MKNLLTLLFLSATFAVASIQGGPAGPARPSQGNAKGSGSECLMGCNDNMNPQCQYTGPTSSQKQTWYPHYECRFVVGPDNCTPLPDAQCYKIEYWTNSTCSGDPNSTVPCTTSTCNPSQPPGEGG